VNIKESIEEPNDAEDSGLPSTVRSFFPRSIVGDYQDDPIMRSILTQMRGRPFSELSPVETIELVGELTAPLPEGVWAQSFARGPFGSYNSSFARWYFESDDSSASQFFQLIAERLRHLETYRPKARDFAIEALQDAFVGFGEDLPTRGIVIEIAKQRLIRARKKVDFSKSSWSELLQAARLDWLQPGRAGRPSKADIDENVKAECECKALIHKSLHETYGGNWLAARDALRAARGSKAEYRRTEQERLR
jgi:hypothetical protein